MAGELILDLVQRHCQRYFNNYVKCVDEFPETWKLDCKKQKIKLTKCAESNPSISTVKYRCSRYFDSYDKCSKEHPSDTESMCVKHFNDFNKCAEKVITDEGIT